MRIVFVGAPTSGKSTLATQVFAALKQAGRSTELVPEWIRGEIAKNGPMTSIWEQYRTRLYQQEIEDAVPADIKFIVCDSGTISPYFYACLYADPSDRRQRLVLQDMHRFLVNDLFLGRYDLIFLLPPIANASIADGVRFQDQTQIRLIDDHMDVLFTKVFRLPQIHKVASGPNSRLEEVMWKILGAAHPELAASGLRHQVIPLINFLKSTSQLG
jgi:nicotinamide riboside kinase